MKICKVVGSVWATKKDVKLEGAKLMIVMPLYGSQGGPFDCRRLCRRRHWREGLGDNWKHSPLCLSAKEGAPIDASIVGIVDSIEIAENEKRKLFGG